MAVKKYAGKFICVAEGAIATKFNGGYGKVGGRSFLEIAKEVAPDALRVLGGVHATFMYKQVLSEAPWIDVIVRGEGEEIMLELIQAIDDGRARTQLDRLREALG